MTSPWYFTYDNAPLSDALQEKLNKFGILNPIPEVNIPNSKETQFVKDFFTADGYPKLGEGMKHAEVAYPYLFPVIAPWYDATAIPAIQLEMEPLYRQTACSAALSWLFNLTGAAGTANHSFGDTARSFHGLAFQEEIQGMVHTFAFPDTRIATSTHGTAAVILIADSYWQNSDWEKQGSVPLYARQQALFQLWCWHRFVEKATVPIDAPETAFIVRICGNLATDCTIRTVPYNSKEAEAMVNRICKARAQEPQKGLYWKRNIETAQTWHEKIENEAFETDNPDLYDLVIEYMKARSYRKALEKEENEIGDRMDSIAVKLASLIPAGNLQGRYDLPDGTVCTVTHQQRRYRNAEKISPELIHSFYPELDECILQSGTERTTVTIEAL